MKLCCTHVPVSVADLFEAIFADVCHMTIEQIKTGVQNILAGYLPNDISQSILYTGVPPKMDPDQLSLKTDLRLTRTDLDEVAIDISHRFSIHFPIPGDNISTLKDLVQAVFKEVNASVGAAANLALAIHMNQLTCPNCGERIVTQRSFSAKKQKRA